MAIKNNFKVLKKVMREILMIDNKSSKWQPILEKSAIHFDFNITNTSSVEEGLVKLVDYPGNIKAVMLALSFAEGEIQGKEGLLKIKAIDNNIPVILLTAINDEFQIISEYIRLGADDYFSQPNVNPEFLFSQIENAIQQSNQRKKQITNTKATKDILSKRPFFYFTVQNDLPSKGYFAYRMNAVASASFGNKDEADVLCQMAWDWHFNFLNTLTFYESDLTLRLRYLFKPGNEYIDPVLLIEFNGISYSQAWTRFNAINIEFELFMRTKKEFGKTVYFFSPVMNENDLHKVLFPFNTNTLIQFTPEFTGNSPSQFRRIGYSLGPPKQNQNNLTIPLLSKPEIKLDNFCEQLFHQRSRTMVEIVLSPVRLINHEIDYLRELSNNINAFHFINIDKENALKTISSYLKTPAKCFNVEVFEAQESEMIGENLLSATSSAFFESATHVNTSSVRISNSNILKKEGCNWNNLYSLSNVPNIFKFPYPFSSSIQGIQMYQPIFGFVPDKLSKTGIVAGIKKIGGNEIPIKIDVEDLRKHLYILGQTGTGKTTVLYSMIMDRIKSGKGVCVIDPHGDLHQKILENLPDERMNDLIRFEPGNPANTIRINLLEYDRDNPQEKSFLIDELFNFFRQEYDVNQTMGPMFEMFMKNSLLLLMDDPDNLGSIGHVARIFQNREFRNQLLLKCKDRDIVDFWEDTAIKLTGDQSLANFNPYIVSKLNQLLINEFIKPIVDTPKSNINFREIVDNDKILLVSLSKGRSGRLESIF